MTRTFTLPKAIRWVWDHILWVLVIGHIAIWLVMGGIVVDMGRLEDGYAFFMRGARDIAVEVSAGLFWFKAGLKVILSVIVACLLGSMALAFVGSIKHDRGNGSA